MKLNLRMLPVALTVLTLSACSTMERPVASLSDAPLKVSDYIKPSDMGAATDATKSQLLLRSGVKYLEAGEMDKAQSVFNVALKIDINNAVLHFLNALTYQLKYEAGEAASYELAVTGYKTALSLDASMDNAHVQLGQLYLRAKNYDLAKKSFAEAYDANSKSVEALLGLAQTSMLAGDLKTSFWATVQLDQKKWSSPQLLRLKAIQAALAQSPDKANEYARLYAEKVGGTRLSSDASYISARVEKLLSMKTVFNPLSNDAVMVAVAATDDKAKEATKEEAKEDAAPKVALNELWFRCDPSPGLTLQKDGLPQIQLPASEENATTLTLPRPCAGEKPPMAMIEVTMIRTEESMQRQQGINLLDGLSLFKNMILDSDKRSVIGNGDSAGYDSAALVYSLNIANSLFQKNEVIARPSLSAVDRLPSVFFSGSNFSVSVGNANSSSLVDRSVGISLSITPTFMEDDNVLLSIRASRSFLEPTDSTTIALSQTRNAVNASARVKFGQTYVLNGMIEREKDSLLNGVPILMDIPIIQNLFSKSIKVDFNRQILTLVTVRRLVDDSDSVYLAKNPKGTVSGHKLAEQVQEFMDLQSNQTVMDEVLAGLRKDNSLYIRLRNRDAIQEGYSSRSVLQRLLMDLKEIAYY
jgi:Tfp pilus assembly protein PilF